MSVSSRVPQFVMALTHLERLYFNGYALSALIETVGN